MTRHLLLAAATVALTLPAPAGAGFDHGYPAYAEALSKYVQPPRVRYQALKADRGSLDRAVAAFDDASTRQESAWTKDRRMAFWINAYNAFTLRAIIDHYPIRSAWFTLQPRDSIRQIDGVWTTLTWQAAGRQVTLDGIEHKILRAGFKDARVHFALNCASRSCPPLAAQPYRAETLGPQLDSAARAYLASEEGLVVDGNTFRVSSIFKWYGEDFIAAYAPLVTGSADIHERAVLGAIATFGPPDAARRARLGTPRVVFLEYNWSLNDSR
ncbi:MAG: DUF547 domain-containing protein [Acidobacteriota bacterium]